MQESSVSQSWSSGYSAAGYAGYAAASASRVYSPHSVISDPGWWRLSPMSAQPQNTPWSSSEKVDLLVNILQGAVTDLPAYLLQLILQHHGHPRWQDIALPQGRSLHSCQIAFEEMRRGLSQPPWHVQPLQISQYPSLAPAVPQKRSFSDNEPPLSAHRPLQPRPVARSTDSPVPPVTNGESPVFMRTIAPDLGSEIPKKRGRPSKAEVEERDRQLALEGKVYQPKKRVTKKPRPSGALELKSEEEAPTPLLQTPTTQAPPARDDSSSGKRRSRRQTREEGSVPGAVGLGDYQDREPAVVESPSDRLLASHRDREVVIPTSNEPAHPSGNGSDRSHEQEQP